MKLTFERRKLKNIFYTLHMMGFQVGHKENAFVFTNVNKEICSQIKRYDKLLHVNYGEAEKKEVIVLTIESEEGEKKEKFDVKK